MPLAWSATVKRTTPSPRLRAQLDAAAIGRMAHGIGDEILDHLLHPIGIARSPDRRLRRRPSRATMRRRRSRSCRLTTARTRARSQRRATQRAAAALVAAPGPAGLRRCARAAASHARRFPGTARACRVGHHVRHPQRLQIPPHRGQRRAEFVADVGQHLPTLCVRGPQRLVARREVARHPVERLCDARDLVAAGVWGACAEIATARGARRPRGRSIGDGRSGRSPASPAPSRQRAPACPEATAAGRPLARTRPIGGDGMTTMARSSPAT